MRKGTSIQVLTIIRPAAVYAPCGMSDQLGGLRNTPKKVAILRGESDKSTVFGRISWQFSHFTKLGGSSRYDELRAWTGSTRVQRPAGWSQRRDGPKVAKVACTR